MAAMTDYLENLLLGDMLSGVATGFDGVVYVGLFSGATTDALTSGGAPQGEIAAAGYARIEVSSGFDILAGVATNQADIEFPVAGASWGTVSGVALFDALTGGNGLIHGTLTTAKAIDTGDVLKFAVDQLSLTYD